MPSASGVVPITLRVPLDGTTREEKLCWDLANSSRTDIEAFAKLYCEENKLPDAAATAVVESIRQQLQLHSKAQDGTALQHHSNLVVVRPCFPLGGKVVQDQFVCDINNLKACVAEFAELMVREQGWPRDFLPDVTWHIHRALVKARREAATPAEDPAKALAEARQHKAAIAAPAQTCNTPAPSTQDDKTMPATPPVKYRVLYPPAVVRSLSTREQYRPQVVDATPELLYKMQANEVQPELESTTSLPASSAGLRSPGGAEAKGQTRKTVVTSRRPTGTDDLPSPPSSQKGRQQAAAQKVVAATQRIPVAQARPSKRPRPDKPEPQQEPQYSHPQQQAAQPLMRASYGSITGHKADSVAAQQGGSVQQQNLSLQALQQLAERQREAQRAGALGHLGYAANNPASYYPVHHQMTAQDALDMFQAPSPSLLGHQTGNMLQANAQLMNQQQRMQQQVAGGPAFGGATANPQMLMSNPGLMSHSGMMRSGGQSMSGAGMNMFGGGFS